MKNKVILLSSNVLGKGDEELGQNLLETFFTILKQREELPAAIFCVNSGVLALTNDSLTSLHLKEIEAKGVDVLACKTCVDFYQIEEKLVAGKISSMAKFIELAEKYEVMTIA
ncbi:DsrE family protein [Bacillus massilinigeriensis]|uniref:DsrE family protein n=1 Tax=Bacillus massilionigeriensis TaxID=1805475 RepID=UPI00096AF077|nr:DsrE family protein [Bacillus massilionigeriensis]